MMDDMRSMQRGRIVLKVILDVTTLEPVGDRSLEEIERLLDPRERKEILWRDADGEWWVHIQRASGNAVYYDVMLRDSSDDILVWLTFRSMKEVEQQTPFRLRDFRIADAWTNQREWVL